MHIMSNRRRGWRIPQANASFPPGALACMNIDFEDEWYGWRLRGRHLVSEDGQRMTVERLRGLMWRDKMELRLKGYTSRRAAEEARQACVTPAAGQGRRGPAGRRAPSRCGSFLMVARTLIRLNASHTWEKGQCQRSPLPGRYSPVSRPH